MTHTACLGLAVAAAAVALLWAAPPVDAVDYVVLEHTAQRVLGPAMMHATPCGMQVAYPQQAYAGLDAPCSCGGSKTDSTCGKSAPTCSCGGSKADGTCTCGKKKPAPCGKNSQADMKDLAEEGIHTLFKVMRGGMKVVEHLAGHINKKTAAAKKQGYGCGCGCGLPPPPPPCGCGCGYAGCGCRR